MTDSTINSNIRGNAMYYLFTIKETPWDVKVIDDIIVEDLRDESLTEWLEEAYRKVMNTENPRIYILEITDKFDSKRFKNVELRRMKKRGELTEFLFHRVYM